MKPTQAIIAVTVPLMKDAVPEFGVGDSVRVSVKVVEGNRERTQVFEGVVMRSRGGGINANFTVRRIAAHGIGVERTFMLHSPRIEKIEVTRYGVVRRAQIYYLRGLTGKAARIKERRYRPGADLKGKKGQVSSVIVIAPTSGVVEPELMVAEDIETMEPEVAETDALDTVDAGTETSDAVDADTEAADTDTDTDTVDASADPSTENNSKA